MVTILRATALKAAKPAIRAAIQSRPAAIVSFHPLLNHLAAETVKEMPGIHVPVVTVITDLVEVHASWICPEVDAIVTPTLGARRRCLSANGRPERVCSIGLPVHPAFTAPAGSMAKTRLRERLGLDPTRFCALVCAGADGSGPIERTARVIAGAELELELIVICGRNRRARERLAGLRHSDGRPVKTYGFVNNMAEIMQAVDVVVTKAGPATIAEALCSELPLLLTWYLPGQEAGNVGWVVETGAGRFVPDPAALIQSLHALVSPKSSELEAMRAAARRAARPDAAAGIAHLIARVAGDGRLEAAA